MSRRTLLLALLFTAAAAFAQPRLTQVSNGASYDAAIAPGSIFVAFGSGLGPAAIVQAPSLPLPAALSGTSIRFTPASGGGAAFDAFMVYTLATQVSGILPSTAPPGAYNVTVTYNGQTSAAFRATVAARSFGMFTLASSGSGPAVLQNAVSATELVVNQFTAPAWPGQVMILYGTGLGAVQVADNVAPGAQDLLAAASVRVLVGGRVITPLYAGRSPGLPGVDQINFQLPNDIPTGCTVPLQIRVGTATTSKPVSMAIAPAGRALCTHPQFSEDVLRRLVAGGSFTVAGMQLFGYELSQTIPGLGSFNTRSEGFSGQVERVTLSNVLRLQTDNIASVLTPGTCVVYASNSSVQGFDVTDPGGSVQLLDAGPSMTLNGPGISNRTVLRGRSLEYRLELVQSSPIPGTTPPAPVIARGEYTLSAPGGAGVRPFTARMQVPERLNWTNRDAITAMRRTQPLTITWAPGGANDLTVIAGLSARNTSGNILDPFYESKLFYCTERASAGTFTVPVDILQQLDVAPLNPLAGTFGQINVQFVPPYDAGLFDATLTDGTKVDYPVFRYSLGSIKLVGVE
ncbi:MAG: hypothetical protein IT162_18725 [Bryobacterales bacterium]|nr:hypothetical protein [Bryobacterales bacterium]